MQSRTVERVESWPSRSFTGGFRELHELADADFSGTVVAAGTWLFMLNGRVIGVFEGDVEDFGDADGTVYEAPHPSVPLLFAMEERDGETQAKYYTNDTPLSEADGTLTDGSFTGFIELSENVLSGDYYVVYYGGRSMSAAFVGNSEELKTGDEAFELADDEVGVYEVVKTPVNVTELPEVEDDSGGSAGAAAGGSGAGAAGAAGAADSDADDAATESDTATTSDAGSAASSDGAAEADAGAGVDAASGGDSSTDTAGKSASEAGGRSSSRAGAGNDDSDGDEGEPRTAGTESAASQQSGSESADAASPTRPSDDGRSGASGAPETSSSDAPAPGAAASAEEGVFDEEREWQNATSVPTIDPDDSKQPASGSSQSSQSSSKRKQKRQREQQQNRKQARQSSDSNSRKQETRKSTVEKLKKAVEQREEKLSVASERIENLEGDRESLESRIDELESERDELQSKLDDLEAELENADSSTPDATNVPVEEALSDTNLFVRYDSKGKATLDELGADTDPSTVNENLRIDHHTQFDAATATVSGEPYEAFLQQSVAYRFVSWAVRELPYEIRDAGHESGLKDLYNAIPDVDRAELDGTVEVETEESGSVSRTFDVVLRDRMGNPLVVADLNTGRDPVRGDEMTELVENATDVREGSDDLSAAMCVTESFFEPAALEEAEEETSNGGFLSGGDAMSYVKLGRKTGYHLCLVEDRNDAFHLTVPEL